MSRDMDYREKLLREARHWGDRLAIEKVERHAWLDHPLIRQHYMERGRLDGKRWEDWITSRLGGPATRSLELGCGSAGRSLQLLDEGRSLWTDGLDVSPDRVAEAEQKRGARGAPGRFQVADVNAAELPANTYDLVFSCHSFHHFEALEKIMKQVRRALTPRGYFVLEEFVGPTQFQWTDAQIGIVRELTTLLPGAFRTLRWGTIKPYEGRPTPAEVVAVSPFESIRSGEIVPLFSKYFDVVATRALGGTLQHLLYNGIVHNFSEESEEARRYIDAICRVEDALIDSGLLPSDFQLLVGRRRGQDG